MSIVDVQNVIRDRNAWHSLITLPLVAVTLTISTFVHKGKLMPLNTFRHHQYFLEIFPALERSVGHVFVRLVHSHASTSEV